MPLFHSTNATKENGLYPENVLETLGQKKIRIKKEMIEAGVTKYGLLKFNARFLHTIVHDLEHVDAIIYGRYSEGPGLLAWADRMIVATDRRLISLNHKPGYTDVDEFTYDIIDGIEGSTAGPFAGVKINSKISTLDIRFVNKKLADKFVHYIEKRRIEYFQGTIRK